MLALEYAVRDFSTRSQLVTRAAFSMLLLATVVTAASANEFTVMPDDPQCENKGAGPYCDIQSALDAAPEGATVRLAAGVYDLWQDGITIERPVTLVGAGADATVLDGGGKGPDAILLIKAAAQDVTVKGMRFVNRMRVGSAELGAGGVDSAAARLTLEAVTIEGNQGGYGGGLHLHGAVDTVELTDVNIHTNKAIVGGGIAFRNGPLASLKVTRGQFVDNFAIFSGGGLFLRDVGEVTLAETKLSGNETGTRGGAIYMFADTQAGPLHIIDSEIAGNASGGTGGVDIKNASIEVFVKNSSVAGNVSRKQPRRADCGAEHEKVFQSLGENRIGNGDGCAFVATSTDHVGSTGAPLSP